MPGKWWVLAAGGAGEVVGAAAGHRAVGKVHLSGRPQKKWAKITPLSPISSSPHIPQRVVRAVGRPAAGQTCLHRVSLYRVNTSDLQNIYPDVPVLSFFPLLRVFFSALFWLRGCAAVTITT